MGAACVKSSDNLAIFVFAKWELGLVAVSPWLVHAHDRQKWDISETADPAQVVVDFIFLEF